MLAAKHFDIVTGFDIHIVNIPTPGGPIPTPVPHPFIAQVFDPMNFVPFFGATVYVNGLPRAQAGTGAKNAPHIPMGGPFLKPIGNEGEMFMGSATVLVEDEPFTYMGLPVLSCSCVGMPSPPRKKQKQGMSLPTSVVLPIPAGMPVIVGGPPTISLSVMAKKVGMSVLGKLLKKFKKAKIRRNKSNKIHSAAGLRNKKYPENYGNIVYKRKCSVTGHPVDIATGKVFTDITDFEIPGTIPLVWERTWFSTSAYKGNLGHGWHHPYDLNLYFHLEDKCLVIRMADGRNIMFSPIREEETAYNLQEKLSLSRTKTEYLLKDADGLTFKFAIPSDNSDEIQRLLSIENEDGHIIRFEYNTTGHLKKIIDTVHRELNFVTDGSGKILAVETTHPDQAWNKVTLVSYRYDAAGNLIESTDADGNKFHYAYDGHLLVKETNRNGLSFYFEYNGRDESARCIRTWGDGGIYNHKLKYNLEEHYTVVENSLGHKTKHFWNSDGLVWKTVDPLGHENVIRFGAFCQKLRETDALGRITYFTYDADGNQTGISFPDGSTVKMEYQGNKLTGASDQMGGKWSWMYDQHGNLVKSTNPIGNVTQYSYQNGLIIEIKESNGNISKLEYDKHRNLSSLISADGSVSRWEYDGLGRCIGVTDPNGNLQKRKFSLNGFIEGIVEPDGNRRELTYDGEGNVVLAKDKHHHIEFEYVGMNRLKARIEAGTRVEFDYNTEDELLAIKNEHGSVYRFELDAKGDVIKESGFDGISRIYTRDPLGRVTMVKKARGIITEYEYDPLDRVTALKHSDGSTETFRYRADGSLTSAANNHITVRFEHDILGRVTKEFQGDYWVESQFDADGNRSSLKSSFGASVDLAFNKMGDINRVDAGVNGSEWQATFKHDNLGLELERNLPGGVRNEWKRDRLGRPMEQNTFGTGGKIARARRYEWDVNNRLKKLIDPKKGTWTFEHDAVGNLSAAQYPDGTFEFRMPDAVGNLFKTKDRKDRKYGPAGQLLEANGTTFSYDAEGNLLKKTEPNGGIWKYEWNASGMLQGVIRPDGSRVGFVYDALGRRISKSYRGKTTRWVWNGNVVLHEWSENIVASEPSFYDDDPFHGMVQARKRKEQLAAAPTNAPPANLITWLFEEGSHRPMAKLTKGQQHSIITDHLGTPVAMFDQHGEKTWEMDLSIYGAVRTIEGHLEDCPFRYPGQYEDIETGLYYNRFRYYDPESGLYMSQDPNGLEGNNPTLYGYVFDSNIEIDVFGLSCLAAKTSTSGGEFLFNTWHKGTFANRTQSVMYHVGKHGNGRTAVQYTQDAMNFFNKNKGLGQNVILKDGTQGIKIQTKQIINGKTQRVGGYWTNDGKLVTFWD